jgi:methylenetetrahydrofolate dehydrogenase (NADP+)/methenyltetrahydrofolate cyclohydrolase
MKRNTCARVGMKSIAVEMSDSTTTEELLIKINELNDDNNVHGILLQHPVPHQIDERLCFDAIDIKKMLMVLPVLVLEICLWVCLLLGHVRQLEL